MTAKIEKIEAIQIAIPFSMYGPAGGFGGTTWTTVDHLLVKVTASDGVVGYGEAFGYNVIDATRAALERTVTPMAIGKACENIRDCMFSLERPLHNFGRSGPVQYALSGLEIALWDMAGKRTGRSIADMLGGEKRHEIDAYASLLKVGERKTLQDVCQKFVEDGFPALKLHETVPELALAARDAIGTDIELMLDVNCAWGVSEAQEAARELEPAGLTWLEEPVWPPEDLAGLDSVAGFGTPIAAGENCANPVSFQALCDLPGVDYVQPSITKVGGVSAVAEIGERARQTGKRLAPHSPYFGPGFMATLQIAAAFPEIQMVEYFGVRLEAPIFGGVELPGPSGAIQIPQGPGLGAEPDPDVLKRYRVG